MAMRSTGLKPDSTGLFYRQIGFKLTASGKRQQPKFRFGRDRKLAKIANARLEVLWSEVEARAQAHELEPLWDMLTLGMARAISKGDYVYRVPASFLLSDDETAHYTPDAYARLLADLKKWFTAITILPEDEQHLDLGKGLNKHFLQYELEQARLYAAGAGVECPSISGRTLYQCFDLYAEDFKQDHPGDYGEKESEAIRRHRDAIGDMPIEMLDWNVLQRIARYWNSRPEAKDRNGKGKGGITQSCG